MTLTSFLKYSIFLTALNFLQVIPQEQHPNDDLIALRSDTIINPHNFQYLLNPTECVCGENRGEDVFLLVYVHSTPDNFARRLSIRETWGKRSMFKGLRLVFMMGNSQNQKVKESLALEAHYYNDIVQEDFHDSYKNLTYKGIMAMKWISEYCDKVSFILKTDDDIMVDTFKLLRHLHTLYEHSYPTKAIYCKMYQYKAMKVMRNKKDKWYVSVDEYGFEWYGQYCSGSAFIMTPDLTAAMYKESQYIKFVWVDDYYITGLLVRAANGSFHQWKATFIMHPGQAVSKFQYKQAPMFGHFGKYETVRKMYKVWSFVLKDNLNNFPKLTEYPYSLVRTNDFGLYEFKWSSEIWEPFLSALNEVHHDKEPPNDKFIEI